MIAGPPELTTRRCGFAAMSGEAHRTTDLATVLVAAEFEGGGRWATFTRRVLG